MNGFKYGQRKDCRRAAKTVIKGQLTARYGIIFECSGRDSLWICQDKFMRRSISRTPSKPVGTDPKHGEFCGHYKATVLIGESMVTAAPFFEGTGLPSKPYWGPQQGRRVILWESLSLEGQQECLTELQNDAEWVVWCKAKPKDKATQTFREYGKCIFEGKRAKVKQRQPRRELGCQTRYQS